MKYNITLTPLIDIIFLLVVFFMLTNQYITTASVTISLEEINPAAANMEVSEEDAVLLLVIKDDRTIIVNNNSLTLERLPSYISQFKRERRIIIDVKEAVQTQTMLMVMEQLHAQQFFHVTLKE